MENSKLKGQLNSDEMVLWWSKPCKMPYMFGLVALLLVLVLIVFFFFFISLAVWYWNAIFNGLIIVNLFLLFISVFQVLDWNATEYMVTDQRVFFDTWIGYAVVNLADVDRVYVKIGLLDRVFGTGNVCVIYEGFDTPTRFWRGGSTIFGDMLVVKHGAPCFRSIKDFVKISRIILDASAGKK